MTQTAHNRTQPTLSGEAPSEFPGEDASAEGLPAIPRPCRHVLCVYPYRRELNHAGFFPPLGLELIATVLRPHAQAMDLVDLRMTPRHTRDFLRPDTDLACFSVNWAVEDEFVQAEIRSIPPSVWTIVGGRHATEDPRPWLALRRDRHIVVRGDGEEAMDEICSGVPLSEIAGVSYCRDGKVHHNPNRKSQPVPEALYPDRRMRRSSYRIHVENIPLPVEIDLMAGSRGCPFNCKFCSFTRNPWGEKRAWSGRSPESVVDELAEIDAPVVGFVDDLFTHDMDRVDRICDLILQRRIRKKYIINARLEIARRPDVIRKMERAGFALLLLGVESAHDKTLRSMGKGFDTARIRQYFQELRHSSMFLHAYFILGNIGESVEEMRQIVPFAKELGVDTIGISMLRDGPYTGLADLVAGNPEYHIAPNGKIYSDFCDLRELRRLHRQLRRQFYTPEQIFHIARKAAGNDGMGLIARLLTHLPIFAYRIAVQKRRRRARRRSRRREPVDRSPEPCDRDSGRARSPG